MEYEFNIFNTVSTGIMVINSDYEIKFWNNVLERWTQLKSSQVIDHKAFEKFDKFGKKEIQSRLKSVFKYGAPVIFSSQIHKYIIPCLLPGEHFRYQHTIVTALKDPRDTTKYLAVFTIHDVSDLTKKANRYKEIYKQMKLQNQDLKIAKQKLENSNLSIRQIIKYSRDAVIIIQNNKIVFHNSAFKQMLKNKDLKSLDYDFSKIQNHQKAVHYDDIETLLTKMESYDTSMELIDENGEIVFVEGRFRVIEFEGQALIFGNLRDLTEKMQLLELLYNEDKKIMDEGKLITMCASCHNIKENVKDSFNWIKLDDYISNITGKAISHGICNTCFEKEYPNYYKQFVNKYNKNRGEEDKK